MATRRGPASGAGRALQLIVAVSSAIIALTGIWLWWRGETQSLIGASASFDLTDPVTLQLWVRRVHLGSTVVLVGAATILLIQSVVSNDFWRSTFLALFVFFLLLGAWTGFRADWGPARLWATTRGTKLGTFFGTGESPLPEALRLVRVHLALVPASLVLIALASYWRDHQRRR